MPQKAPLKAVPKSAYLHQLYKHLFKKRPHLKAADYSAADIEVLEGLEPVRRRPGMYIGGTDEKALHHLFRRSDRQLNG